MIAAPMLGWSCFLVAATLYLRSMYRQIRNIPAAPSIRHRLAQWVAERRNRDDEDFPSEFFEPQDTPRPAVASVATLRPRPVTPATWFPSETIRKQTSKQTSMKTIRRGRTSRVGWPA